MKHTLFIFALITASIQTFAQSPRIKLNQITKDSVTGSVLISSPTDSGMVYSRDLFISYGSDTVLILGGDTLAKTSGIISSVLSDGVTITGDGTLGNELTADTSVLATLRALSDSLVNYVSTTELSDSTTNIRTDLDLKQDQLNGTGFVKATGTTITYDNSTYLTSEVDGDASNELQTLSYNSSTNEITLSDGGGTEDLSNLDLVDSTRLTTDSILVYYQNGSEIGRDTISGISGGGGGTTYNNISENFDTVFISDHLDVDTSTLFVDADNNRVAIGQKQTLSGGALALRGSLHIIDADTGSISDQNIYIFPKEQTTSGPNSSEFAFYVAGPGSGSSNDGPFFTAKGINYVRSANERGAFFMLAGNVTSPVGYDGTISFWTSNSERLKIAANGNVGIGTSSPSYPLEMGSGAHVTTGGVWTDASDIKLKTNINYIYPYGLEDIMNLKPTMFDYKNGEKNSLGFIAQDIYEIIPEAISSTLDEYGNETMGLKMVSITATLTKAIQEQQATIESIQTELDAKSSTIESQATEIEQLKTLIQELSNRLQILENN